MGKLCVVISARASYSRVRSILLALKESGEVEFRLVLVASASLRKYGDLSKYVLADSLKVDFKVESQLDLQSRTSMAKSTALTILGLADYLAENNFSAVLVVADRHETLAITSTSAFLGLNTIHLQGGERTGNIDDKVRFANSFLSDFHFVASEEARERLLKMEFSGDKVFNIGCPSIDFAAQAVKDENIRIDFQGVGASAKEILEGSFLVVLQHPETTSHISPRHQIRATIEAVENSDLGAFWIWPNSDFGGEELLSEIRKAREEGKLSRVHFEKSIDPESFLRLVNTSKCIVGNSSLSVREGAFLGVPAVNIGTRQKDRSSVANTMDVPFDTTKIGEAIRYQSTHQKYPPETRFGSGGAGHKAVSLLKSIL